MLDPLVVEASSLGESSAFLSVCVFIVGAPEVEAPEVEAPNEEAPEAAADIPLAVPAVEGHEEHKGDEPPAEPVIKKDSRGRVIPQEEIATNKFNERNLIINMKGNMSEYGKGPYTKDKLYELILPLLPKMTAPEKKNAIKVIKAKSTEERMVAY